MKDNLVIPGIIRLEDFNGNWENFENAVYKIFKKDFISTKPLFEGQKISLKIHPTNNFKEATYYHITHDGADEADRKPNLRRMERIGHPKPIIENNKHNSIKYWKTLRGNKTRILLLHEEEQYLVVLEERPNYILFWTSYYIEYKNQLKRFLIEHDEYHKKQKSPE